MSLSQEITKRLHLNALIQGAAVTASSCLNPIPDLAALHPDFLELNRRVGVAMQLSQFETRSYLLAGRTGGDARRYWSSTGRKGHPFYRSQLFRQHGESLAIRTYSDSAERAQQVGIPRINPRKHDRQLLENIKLLHAREAPRRNEVARVAIELCAREWAIPSNQLIATLRSRNAPGKMLPGQQAPTQLRERLNAWCAAGWSRVDFGTSPPRVEAAALVFTLLRHELVKGIAELCCSHGLALLDDRTYTAVIENADKITLERGGMQVGRCSTGTGCSRYRTSVSPAVGLAQLSMADPDVVESTLIAVVEDPAAAQEIMTHLCADVITDLE